MIQVFPTNWNQTTGTCRTPEEAAAWVSYALHSHRRDLGPLPNWILEGERHWDLLPFVRIKRVYETCPRCMIERDHARLLRRSLVEAMSQLKGTASMAFHFGGRVLDVQLDGRNFAVLAMGDPWPSAYEITVNRETTMPARFRSERVEISVYENFLHFDRCRYPAKEITA